MGVELPFMFRPENVARYDDGNVLVLDRRIYPFKVEFLRCRDYEDVAQAIEQMVTQSYGPGYAAGYGMALAARQAQNGSSADFTEQMETAARRLINTRPTNHQVRLIVTRQLATAREAIDKGQDVEAVLLESMEKVFAERHSTGMELGRFGASLLDDGDVILNHCWAELGLVYTMYAALLEGKKLTAYCSETRPYLQGARLTATALLDMGIPTTVVTDNMPGHIMYQGKISKFLAGADRVTMDGHAINKIGTFPHALSAHFFGIPTFIFCPYGPDAEAPTLDDVTIEERDPQEVLQCRGVPTAVPGASGYYPAFDVVPPKLVSGLITDRGVFSPYRAHDYYAEQSGTQCANW